MRLMFIILILSYRMSAKGRDKLYLCFFIMFQSVVPKYYIGKEEKQIKVLQNLRFFDIEINSTENLFLNHFEVVKFFV
jgi:hypothetical protein